MTTFDSRADAERLAAPLRAWARLGFLRGFAGTRSDLGPKGRLVMPSAAFREAVQASLGGASPVDEHEAQARRRYVEDVETYLHDFQSNVVVDHYRKAFLGWCVDLAMGWTIVAIAVAAWYFLGIHHPATMTLLVLLSAKVVLIQVFVRRRISQAMVAFRSSSADVSLPWQAHS